LEKAPEIWLSVLMVSLSLLSFFLDVTKCVIAPTAIFIADGEVVFTRYKTDSPLLFSFAGRKKMQ
jgi:hypothetical protein